MMQGQATPNQVSFIERLAAERGIGLKTGYERQSKQDASDFIKHLLSIKPVPAAQAAVASAIVDKDGMYRTPDGTIYKVQYNKAQGDGRRCYAKRLVIDQDAERDGTLVIEAAKVHFEYEAGAVRKLTPAMKMTLEEAKAFGALYGTCCRCGRTLTREVSIERGMGPVCSGAFD